MSMQAISASACSGAQPCALPGRSDLLCPSQLLEQPLQIDDFFAWSVHSACRTVTSTA